jgi:hypothetical protein
MCEMLPQIALESDVFIDKTLKNQGSNKYFEVSKSTCMTRGNALGFELKMIAPG